MDVLHPMLVTPVIQSMCFTDFFQANLPRLFPIPATAHKVASTTASPTTASSHRRLPSVSTSDGAAIKIQAFVRGSLQRRSRRVDAQPGEWKAKHVARLAHQINAPSNTTTSTAASKDKPRVTPVTLMQLRRHNPSPPPGPSPTSTPNLNSTPSPSPPPPLTASVNGSNTLQPLPVPIVTNASTPLSTTELHNNRPLRNSTGSLGLATGALNAKAAPAGSNGALPLAQPLPIRSSSTSSLNGVAAASNSTVPTTTAGASLAPVVAQRSFSEGASNGLSPHLSPSVDPMLLITSRRGAPPPLDSTESLVSMMLSPNNGSSNNSSGSSSPLELDFDRAAENVSVLSYSSTTLQPLCLISAESRLLTLRKQGGRNIPAGSMTVLQLLEEKKALKKELTLARENHLLVAPGSGVGGKTTTTGAGVAGGKKSTTTTTSGGGAAAAAGGPRARSISPSLYRSNSTPPASSTSGSPAAGMIQCDCCANAWQAGFDWKSLYQPLLLQYKLVNAALKNKGVQLSHSASDHSLGLTHHAAPIAHRPVSASGTSNSTLTIHQSSGSSPSPLLSSLVYGLQNPSNAGAPSTSPSNAQAQPQRAASPLMNTSNNAAVVAAAAKRKQGSASGAAGLSVGNSLNSNANSNAVAATNGTAGSNSRSHSRSASPASHGGGGGSSSAGPSPQFAAWTAQSQNAVQAAQLPSFKLQANGAASTAGGSSSNASMVTGGSSNSQILQQASAIYGAGSQGNSVADWQRLKMLKQSISKRKNST